MIASNLSRPVFFSRLTKSKSMNRMSSFAIVPNKQTLLRGDDDTLSTRIQKQVMSFHSSPSRLDIADAARYIGAGFAAFGLQGAGYGVGQTMQAMLSGEARNPGAGKDMFGHCIVGLAFAEMIGFMSLGLGFMILKF